MYYYVVPKYGLYALVREFLLFNLICNVIIFFTWLIQCCTAFIVIYLQKPLYKGGRGVERVKF